MKPKDPEADNGEDDPVDEGNDEGQEHSVDVSV